MPRRNKKGVKGRTGDSNSDDESCIDNASIYSYASDNASSSVNDVDETSTNERFEEKFLQALENTTEKSSQTRTSALQSICEILMHRYMPDFISNRKITLGDCIEKSIRRGKGVEQTTALRLLQLLMLQLGSDELVCKPLKPFLLTIVQDNSVPYDARAKACSVLSLMTFLGSEDTAEVLSLMNIFETIFSNSYLRGDDKIQLSVHAEEGALHAEALAAWSLLLTLLPPGDFVSIMNTSNLLPSLKKFLGLLESTHLDVRISAGETLALMLELGRAHDEEFFEEYLEDLVDAVKKLATDSHKYRAKRDRKTQRATFRDVLRFIEEDISPEIKVRFGNHKEDLILDSWAVHRWYSTLCAVTGPGMNCQLQENELVRDLFELGAKISNELSSNSKSGNKQTKQERHLMNAAAFKARSISRGKNRDKRSVVFN